VPKQVPIKPGPPGVTRFTRIELERSYRPLSVVFLLAGLGFNGLGLVVGEPLLMLAGIPGLIIAIGLWRLDPREFIAIDHLSGKIQNERHQGRGLKVRREFRLDHFERLELVRYRVRRRGKQCMLVLVHKDGHLEKLDDRPDKKDMADLAQQIALAAGLPFVDKGEMPRE
jgi:hypothetical protein